MVSAKPSTIPRLELAAAVHAADLMRVISEALSQIRFDKIRLFTDSIVTLHRIRSDPKKWDSFVSRRVELIQAKTDIHQWYHLPTEMNPADMISRDLSLSALMNNSLWFQGPEYGVVLTAEQKTQRIVCAVYAAKD